MLKKIKIVVIKEIYEEYEISEDEGYDMPEGSQETFDFVNTIRYEVTQGAYKPKDISEESEIHSMELIDSE
jgi:hypothetical protein